MKLQAQHGNCSVVGCTDPDKSLYQIPFEDVKEQGVNFLIYNKWKTATEDLPSPSHIASLATGHVELGCRCSDCVDFNQLLKYEADNACDCALISSAVHLFLGSILPAVSWQERQVNVAKRVVLGKEHTVHPDGLDATVVNRGKCRQGKKAYFYNM